MACERGQQAYAQAARRSGFICDKAGSNSTATSDFELEQMATDSSVSCLLDRLKSPTVLDLVRKRKV